MAFQNRWEHATSVYEEYSSLPLLAQTMAIAARCYFERKQYDRMWEALHRLREDVVRYQQADWQLSENWAVPYVLSGFANERVGPDMLFQVWEHFDSFAVIGTMTALGAAAIAAKGMAGPTAALPFVRKIYERAFAAQDAAEASGSAKVAPVHYYAASACVSVLTSIHEFDASIGTLVRRLEDISAKGSPKFAWTEGEPLPRRVVKQTFKNRFSPLSSADYTAFVLLYHRTFRAELPH